MAYTLNILQIATDRLVKRTVNKCPENYKKIKFSCSNSFVIQQNSWIRITFWFQTQRETILPSVTT